MLISLSLLPIAVSKMVEAGFTMKVVTFEMTIRVLRLSFLCVGMMDLGFEIVMLGLEMMDRSFIMMDVASEMMNMVLRMPMTPSEWLMWVLK